MTDTSDNPFVSRQEEIQCELGILERQYLRIRVIDRILSLQAECALLGHKTFGVPTITDPLGQRLVNFNVRTVWLIDLVSTCVYCGVKSNE